MPHFSPSLPLFFLLTLPLLFKPAYSTVGGNETDRLALLAFKAKITNDPFHVMSSWNNSLHFCQWQGVTCGARHRRVVDLDLRSSSLAGSISPHLFNLSFLRGLQLQSNRFAREIPPEIGRLRRLRILNLHNNSLVGHIPANLSGCGGLTVLRLSRNKLSGEIPVELGGLAYLEVLTAAQNELVGGIPSSLGNLTRIGSLFLDTNRLGGAIPRSLGQLRNISILELGVNEFVGTIPPSIFNLSSMEVFDVQQNHLQGTLPSDLFLTLPRIWFFNILFNNFNGSIPSSISNATNLEQFYGNTNNFTGQVPNLHSLVKLERLSLTTNHLGSGGDGDLSFISSLANSRNLLKLSVNNNDFGGVIPESISNLSRSLYFLLLDNNRIHGSIPCGVSNLVNLTRLELWENKLSGGIPECLGKLEKLEVLFLNNNEFTGHIPDFLGDSVFLNSLDLGRNNIRGSIPSSLGNCQRLALLDLSVNNLTGSIPSKLFTLSSLSIALVLSNNQLTGALPFEVENLENLGALDVSNNLLSGEIPSSLSSCVRLEALDMSGNSFNGTIPPSWSSLRGLQTLDLSRNNLSGEIPSFLNSLEVKNLNLSFNDFSGMVPNEGIFKNATAVSLQGNVKLCGGVSKFHLPKCETKNPKTLKVKYLVLTVLALLLGAMLVLCTIIFCCFEKKRRGSSAMESSMFQMSYRTLQEATDGFSTANLIGKGGFGSVYRGSLGGDDDIVAVKVFDLKKRGASSSFMAECNALRNIRHRNLVKVVTACSSIDGRGNDFKAIVYEFMSNGSLEEWLHPNSSLESTRKLNFLQRLNKVIDVAAALDYLHYQCHTTIVHCDLKPSNVLLDDDMVAHVSDFGLMKFFAETSHDFPLNHGSSIGVRGTVGYTAPDYGMGSEVATSGDMYSYGILLLEMFTGKRPTDDVFDADTNLRSYVNAALPEKVEEVVDPALRQGIESDEWCDEVNVEKLNESVISIFEIGVACSEETPRERMNVRDALTKLVSIRDNLVRKRKEIGHKKSKLNEVFVG